MLSGVRVLDLSRVLAGPLAGMILGWATKTAWAVVDAERAGGDPVAVAQLAADRAVDLIEYLKAGKAAS